MRRSESEMSLFEYLKRKSGLLEQWRDKWTKWTHTETIPLSRCVCLCLSLTHTREPLVQDLGENFDVLLFFLIINDLFVNCDVRCCAATLPALSEFLSSFHLAAASFLRVGFLKTVLINYTITVCLNLPPSSPLPLFPSRAHSQPCFKLCLLLLLLLPFYIYFSPSFVLLSVSEQGL